MTSVEVKSNQFTYVIEWKVIVLATTCFKLPECACVDPVVNKKTRIIIIYYNQQQFQQQSVALYFFPSLLLS